LEKENIAFTWTILGTRPNMLNDMCLETLDLSSKMTDFKNDHVFDILSNYFAFSEPLQPVFHLCQRLSGPPKLVYFFLKAAF
jgi:hypothetical protein